MHERLGLCHILLHHHGRWLSLPPFTLCLPCEHPAKLKIVAIQGEGAGTAAQGSSRRLVLTSAALLERRTDTYEVAERRQLPLLAALVRFVDQPQWLALEWSDGAAPSMYITPARENLLTALLDTAQVSCLPSL